MHNYWDDDHFHLVPSFPQEVRKRHLVTEGQLRLDSREPRGVPQRRLTLWIQAKRVQGFDEKHTNLNAMVRRFC